MPERRTKKERRPGSNVGSADAGNTDPAELDNLAGLSAAAAAGPQFQIVDGQIVLDASSLSGRPARARRGRGRQYGGGGGK